MKIKLDFVVYRKTDVVPPVCCIKQYVKYGKPSQRCSKISSISFQVLEQTQSMKNASYIIYFLLHVLQLPPGTVRKMTQNNANLRLFLVLSGGLNFMPHQFYLRVTVKKEFPRYFFFLPKP